MGRHDSGAWDRGLPAGTPAVESVSHVAAHLQEETKPDVLIDVTDSHVVDFEGPTIPIIVRHLAHAEDRQVWWGY